jgi:hypothetical protein
MERDVLDATPGNRSQKPLRSSGRKYVKKMPGRYKVPTTQQTCSKSLCKNWVCAARLRDSRTRRKVERQDCSLFVGEPKINKVRSNLMVEC